MIDVSKAKWTLSEETVFAVEWFEKNGFSGSLDKQYLSKTKFTVSKNGVTDKFELPHTWNGTDSTSSDCANR